jgi:hypothetical protein
MEENLFAMGGGLAAFFIGRKLCLLLGKPKFPHPWQWMSLKTRIFHVLRISFSHIVGYMGILGGLTFLFQLAICFLKIIP